MRLSEKALDRLRAWWAQSLSTDLQGTRRQSSRDAAESTEKEMHMREKQNFQNSRRFEGGLKIAEATDHFLI